MPPSDARPAGFLDAVPAAMLAVDRAGVVLDANALAEALFGAPRSELVGRSVERLFPDAQLRAQLERGAGARLTVRARRKDGSGFPAELSLGALVQGGPGEALLTIRDVSGRAALVDPSQALLDSTPDAVVVSGSDGKLLRINDQAERLFGYRREELIGQHMRMLLPERLRDEYVARRTRYLERPQPSAVAAADEMYCLRKDGSEFPVEISVAPLVTEQGVLVSASIRDITARKSAEGALAKLAAIVESANDAIIGLGVAGTIDIWNPAAERLYGFKREEVLGRRKVDIVPLELQAESTGNHQRALRGERVELLETVRLAKDGSRREVAISIAPIRGRGGDIVGVAGIHTDLRPRRQAEAARASLEAERKARSEAEEASEMKSSFMGLISHEIRSPLAALDVNLRVLVGPLEASLSPAQQRAFGAIQRSSKRLSKLVESVLEHSRLESKRVALDLAALDVATLLPSLDAELRPQAEEKGLTLSLPVPALTRAPVTDVALARLVLRNLLENAIRYTERGAVTLQVEETPEAHRFAVTDTGEGIAPENHQRIFEPFEQLEPIAHKHRPGVGLGLTLVKRIATALGGHIELSSALGAGSTFTLVLPVRQPQ